MPGLESAPRCVVCVCLRLWYVGGECRVEGHNELWLHSQTSSARSPTVIYKGCIGPGRFGPFLPHILEQHVSPEAWGSHCRFLSQHSILRFPGLITVLPESNLNTPLFCVLRTLSCHSWAMFLLVFWPTSSFSEAFYFFSPDFKALCFCTVDSDASLNLE